MHVLRRERGRDVMDLRVEKWWTGAGVDLRRVLRTWRSCNVTWLSAERHLTKGAPDLVANAPHLVDLS
jgi:hypothetical protein